MVSNADEKGLSHNQRHKGKPINPFADPSEFRLILAARPVEFSYFEKWGYSIPELANDLEAFELLSKMSKLWLRLTPNERSLYLETAERIAEAEKAKSTRKSKLTRNRHIRVAKSAVAAANFVQELSLIFPPPWVGDETKIGELVFGLASFISGARMATYPWTTEEAVDAASGLLLTAEKRISRKAGGMKWALLRDLVWLASGKKLDLDERSVRRYLEKQRPARNLADAYWRPNWELMGNASRLAKQWLDQPIELAKPNPAESLDWSEALHDPTLPKLDSKSFERAVHGYLASPRASILSR